MASYKVEHITYDDPAVTTDITLFIYQIDNFNLYSDGRISTASITLQASNGAFRTNPSGGTTPILENLDMIKITATDSDGNSYSHIFEIINDLGQLDNTGEYLLPLTLEGRERALSQIPFSGYFDNPPLSHSSMVQKILEVYNDSFNSARQPFILTLKDFLINTNLLPRYNPNIWDFLYIDNCLDAIQAVVRLADQSVSAGGGGDRFAIIYEDEEDIANAITLRIIPQGQNNSTGVIPTIRGNELSNPIQVIAKTKQPLTGTTVIARGKPGSGGVPVQGDEYRSRLEFYQRIILRQNWDDGIFYDVDSYTSFGGVLYQARLENIDIQPNLNPAYWRLITIGDYIGDVQYSPFTIDKAGIFRNECTNPQLSFNPAIEDSPKMLDCNIVINDLETKRDFVWLRQITDDTTAWSVNERHYLFRDEDIYDGFRILVDSSKGTPSGAFSGTLDAFETGAGNDPNGLPYRDNPVIFSNGKWYVIKVNEPFDQIVVRFEGLFEWNSEFVTQSRFPADDGENPNRRYRISKDDNPGAFAWRELGDQFLANDCLHSPASITNVDGLIAKEAKSDGGFYTDDSAVRIVYQLNKEMESSVYDDVLGVLLGLRVAGLGFLGALALDAALDLYHLFTTPYYRSAGWWITFSSPFPFSNHNGIQEQVGQLYGSGTSTEVEVLNKHSTFDAFNKNASFTGKVGWNQDDSNDLMEITGATFLFKLEILVDDRLIPFTGDIPCSYWAIDDNGTLWKSKQKYRHLGDVQRMTFDFGDFSPVYYARTPFGIDSIITNILVPELEIRERLFPNRIRMQGFMLEGSYDEHGRYLPNIWETIIKPTIFSFTNPTSLERHIKFVGDIDYFQWIKTPIAIAKAENANRTIFPDLKDYPNISNIEQLQRAANADIDVETFQYEQYEIKRNDKADVSLQDSVYLYEKNMINEAEAPRPENSPNWIATTKYYQDNTVSIGGTIYIAQDTNTNKSPATNPEYWSVLNNPMQNTRLLTVGEIGFTVSKDKEIDFSHTLIRRIPRVI